MTEGAPDWVINVPSTDAVHDEPPPANSWEGIADTALQGLRENLIEAIVGLIGQLPDIALNLIRQLIHFVDGAEDMIFEIINMVLGWITGAPDLIITVIETALAWLIEIPELFVSVVNAIVGLITDIPDVIVSIIDALLEWITSIPDLILTVVDTFLSWISDDSDLIITVVEAALQWLVDVPDMVTSIVEAFLDFITSIPDVTESILNAIESWVDSIPDFITDLITAFFGWITDVPELLVKVVEKILDWFTDDNNLVETVVSTWLTFITEIPDLIGLIISTWIEWIIEAPGMVVDFITRALLPFGLLGPNSPLNALNIFGLLNNFNIPLLNLGSLTNQPGPNLLVAPTFDDITSLGSGTGWAWDGSVGKTSPGSARATAGGAIRQLNSIPIPVAQDQVVDVSVWVRWLGLTYSGTTPFAVVVSRYNGAAFVGSATIAQPVSPASNNSSWTNYTGTYTIPSGCDTIRLSFVVSSTATAGQLWFDDASLKKQGSSLPQMWITGLTDALAMLENFVKDVVRGILSAIGLFPIFGPGIADFLEKLIDGVTGWFDDTEATAAVASDAKIGLQTTQDIIVSGIAGSDQSDVDDSAVAAAVQSQTAVIVQQGAALQALTSQLIAENNSGTSILDDFEYVTTDLALQPQWTRFVLEGTDPKIGTPDGHNAEIDSDGVVMYRHSTETATNFQSVTATVASQLVSPGFGDGRRPAQDVYCRVSADGTKWVRLRWNNVRQYSVDYRNGAASGSLYTSPQGSNSQPGPGSGLTIEPGVGALEGQFRILKGITPIRIVEDTAHVTDWTPKGVGVGFRRASGFAAGAFTQFSASDNAPALVYGTQMRAFRSLGNVNMGSRGGGTYVVPDNYFNVLDFIGGNCSWNATTQELTVQADGLYSVYLSFYSSSGFGGDPGITFTSSITRDVGSGHVPFRHVNSVMGISSSVPEHQLRGMVIIPLKAGQKIKPALTLGGSIGGNDFTGDVNGLLSEFAVMKVA